ncbi:hypothetical protein VE00_10660 [Pseudogymnoascus sp. WSF 3629]|nr:hypothetical protein VE00_10660 [Pseudogymnoascus sp. WSF 3629]
MIVAQGIMIHSESKPIALQKAIVRPGTRSVPESAQFGAQIGPEPNPAENSVLSSAEHPAPTYLAELLVAALLFSCTGETCQRRVHLADYSTEQSAVSYTAPWGPSLQQHLLQN